MFPLILGAACQALVSRLAAALDERPSSGTTHVLGRAQSVTTTASGCYKMTKLQIRNIRHTDGAHIEHGSWLIY
jgi:hypothetical protein